MMASCLITVFLSSSVALENKLAISLSADMIRPTCNSNQQQEKSAFAPFQRVRFTSVRVKQNKKIL